MRQTLIRDGYVLMDSDEYAFPVPAWQIELEVSGKVGLSASEQAVLRLAGAGLGTTEELARAMGFGADVRLVASTATRLLEVSGLAIVEGRLATTPLGKQMLSTAGLVRRQVAVETVYFHPLDREWTWNGPARPPRSVVWTIDLAAAAAGPGARSDMVGDLVRASGAPHIAEQSVGGVAVPLELLSLREISGRVAYEAVTIETWQVPKEGAVMLLGIRDGAEDERLTRALDGAERVMKRRRLRLRPVAP